MCSHPRGARAPNATAVDADGTEVVFGHKARLHCPDCDNKATVTPINTEVRLVCPACGRSDPLLPWPKDRPFYFEAAVRIVQQAGLELWHSAECCGGHHLWALDEEHARYALAFMASRNRNADFPSPPGDRQLADKFPAWMVIAKHRLEVTRVLARMLEE